MFTRIVILIGRIGPLQVFPWTRTRQLRKYKLNKARKHQRDLSNPSGQRRERKIVTLSKINIADAAYKSDRIVFPGPTLDNKHGTEEFNEPVAIPDSCRNLTYCFEKPANYPQERYNKMFEGKNLAPLPTIVESTLANRLGEEDYEDDCGAVVRYDPLYSIQTQKGDWLHIIQAPKENFQQKVRTEICTSTTDSCLKEYPNFAGITTFCRQKTAKYEFVVDDGKGGTAKLEAELPSCCVCHYKTPI